MYRIYHSAWQNSATTATGTASLYIYIVLIAIITKLILYYSSISVYDMYNEHTIYAMLIIVMIIIISIIILIILILIIHKCMHIQLSEGSPPPRATGPVHQALLQAKGTHRGSRLPRTIQKTHYYYYYYYF